MKPRKPLDLPNATAEQWLQAFRETEKGFGSNKSRMWVIKCMVHTLRNIVNAPEEK